jgi:hypothetical protein
LSEGIALLEKLRDEHLDVPSYSMELAGGYRRRGLIANDPADLDKTQQEYRRMLRVNPTFSPIVNSLAWRLASGNGPPGDCCRNG